MKWREQNSLSLSLSRRTSARKIYKVVQEFS